MKKIRYTLIIILACISTIYSQSIRKDYNEMTESEKQLFVQALYVMRDLNGDNNSGDSNRDDDDLILDIANFHGLNFRNIHFNLPQNTRSDVFLAWHRASNFELEQAMQDYVNPKISIPLWNWVTDRSSSDALWDNNFLGQFEDNWGVTRNFRSGSFPLPTSNNINAIQAVNFSGNGLNAYQNYSNQLERGNVHTGGHMWVRGTMASGESPLDPVFYLHHGMVDKLWQDWEKRNTGLSSFIRQDMPRYDGNYSFNGVTLPRINPNDIIDSKSLGVFFAENEYVKLHQYNVSNTHNPVETFYYQFHIDIKDGFVVPNTKKCLVESVKNISLKAGFHARAGSNFIAKIDRDNKIMTLGRSNIVKNYKNSFKGLEKNVYENITNKTVIKKTLIHPNPFNEVLHINSTGVINNWTLSSMVGKVVIKGKEKSINTKELVSGIYILRITLSSGEIVIKKVIKE